MDWNCGHEPGTAKEAGILGSAGARSPERHEASGRSTPVCANAGTDLVRAASAESGGGFFMEAGAPPLLRGRRCLLRPQRSGDADRLARIATDAEVTRFLFDEFDVAEWCAAAGRAHGFDFWVVEPRHAGSGAEADAIGFFILQPGRGGYRCSAEVSYWIGREWWGRGVMSEALATVTAWAWQRWPPLTRLQADVFPGNGASRRVAAKCGYVLEGVRPRSAIKDGCAIDILQYAAYRPDGA